MQFNNVDSNIENVVTINCNLFLFSFFKINKFELKMKLQSLFCSKKFQMHSKHALLYLSLIRMKLIKAFHVHKNLCMMMKNVNHFSRST